jgi:hypothetical protein
MNSMPLDLADIRALVDTGDFSQLIGEIEGQHLDVKSQPYSFHSGNDPKREFAKDVAAFANVKGGCIIIGAETITSTLQPGEQITALKPFPGTLFSPDQCRKLIAEWLYPQPSGVIINWYPDENTPTSGMGLVFIPPQDPATKPFLITRSIGDKKTTEILLGYVERHVDRTDVNSVVELHHALRTGMNLEATLLSRVTNLETLLQRQLASTPILQQSSPVPPAITDARVVRIVAKPQFSDTRTLVIIVTPAPPSELRSIFSDQPNSIRRALEDPPELRRRGWGIGTGSESRFIDGDFIQTDSFRHVVDLYRDGQFIVGVRIDGESLAWTDKTHGRIHPLAFVEFVTNALSFYRLVLADMRITPQALHIELRLGGLMTKGEGTSLPAGGINNVGWTLGYKVAPAAAWSRTITVDAATYSPPRAAFLLLREVYAWFGYSEEDIPYATGIGDDRVIDAIAISDIH